VRARRALPLHPSRVLPATPAGRAAAPPPPPAGEGGRAPPAEDSPSPAPRRSLWEADSDSPVGEEEVVPPPRARRAWLLEPFLSACWSRVAAGLPAAARRRADAWRRAAQEEAAMKRHALRAVVGLREDDTALEELLAAAGGDVQVTSHIPTRIQ